MCWLMSKDILKHFTHIWQTLYHLVIPSGKTSNIFQNVSIFIVSIVQNFSLNIKLYPPNLVLGSVSVHKWSMHSSGIIGSVSGAKNESLKLPLGEWETLCLFGDWLWLERLNLCTPEKECTPKAGEWARLQNNQREGITRSNLDS